MNITIKELFEIFNYGVDYGLLQAEEERAGEEWGDAFNGYCGDKKYAMPVNPIERRHLHSEKWFEAKNKSVNKFKELLVKVAEMNSKGA
ncbi:MAG: hypothetical protein MJ180_00120 [Candidatus Gastranaerophilales bacterium]|nr:hypothetical protein [Candidatus Gastranaerophilales bacterium]